LSFKGSLKDFLMTRILKMTVPLEVLATGKRWRTWWCTYTMDYLVCAMMNTNELYKQQG